GAARQAALLLADCYAFLGNPDQQAAACRSALKIDPSWTPAGLRLAEALAALGKIDDAVAQFRALSRQAPGVKVEVVRLQLARALTQPPDRRRWDELDKAWDDLSREQKEDTEGRLLRAEMLVERGKPDEARREAQAACDADPKQPGPWLALAALARRRDKADEAPKLLDEAERQAGKRLE